jgi:ABC-type antimicrobial peptide transport system permease subunit
VQLDGRHQAALGDLPDRARPALAPHAGLQALALAAIGLPLGATLGWAASRALGSALRGAVAFEPMVLASVAALLATAALAAAFVPARRALAVDPARALRAE